VLEVSKVRKRLSTGVRSRELENKASYRPGPECKGEDISFGKGKALSLVSMQAMAAIRKRKVHRLRMLAAGAISFQCQRLH